MNKRNRDLLIYLSNQVDMCTITDLSEVFNVSERTIRNDLVCINEFLKEHKLSLLELKNNGKISIAEDLKNIRQFQIEKDLYTYKLSKEERIHCMCCILIQAKQPITLKTIAEKLMVSRATTINDLEEVKQICRHAGLQVGSYSNKGLYIDGSEMEKRLLLLNIICQYTEYSDVNRIQMIVYPGMDLSKAVNRQECEVLHNIVVEQEAHYGLFLTDDSLGRLQCYLMIVLQRMSNGKFLEKLDKNHENKFNMALNIMKLVVQYCNLVMDENEVILLSNVLDGLHYQKTCHVEADIVKVQLVTRRFIEIISDSIQIDLKHDLTFQQDLSNHLIAVFKSSAMVPRNKVIEQVVKENRKIEECVNNNIEFLEAYSSRKLTRADINYIVVHVCAAVERTRGNQKNLNIILACNAGVGTSRLLYANLKSRYSFRICKVLSAHELENIKKIEEDFIISTTEVHHKDVESVVVSAIPTLGDYKKINEVLSRIMQKKSTKFLVESDFISIQDKLLKEIKSIVFEELGSNGDSLNIKIAKSIKAYLEGETIKDNENTNLSNLVTNDLIQLDVECKTWQETVQKSAEILFEKDFIEKRYIKEMIQNIEVNGPYVVLAKGLAIPHASFEAGAKKLGMSMIRLLKPVSFGHKTFKEINFICCLSPVDGKSHLRALMQLADIFSSDDNYQQFCAEETSIGLHRLIQRYEEKTREIRI